MTEWSNRNILCVMPPPDLVGTVIAADILDVSVVTAKRMAMSGELPVALKMPGDTGAYLFERTEVERVRDERAAAKAAARAEAAS